MPGYLDLAHRLATRIAEGDPPAGEALPGVRALARTEGTGTSTAARALEHLGRAGVLDTRPRRLARVPVDGALRARAYLAPATPLRIAGSDDPALTVLAEACGGRVQRLAPTGSTAGLVALREGRADAAVLHLWHASGVWNDAYARLALGDQPALLVHLWEREQGILLPPGNPDRIAAIADLRGRVVARRQPGAGTRALEAHLLRLAGLPADALSGPELPGHLEIAIAVASGLADAGLGIRAATADLELDFVSLGYEPFDLAIAAAERGRLAPLLSALADPELRARLEGLGGYDLARSGEERAAG
jgi:molybdate-binding protein